MNRIDVLIVIDAVAALASGSLQGNVYLVDTNKYLGSWQEGQSELNTVCQDGQLLTWSAVPVNPGSEVSIEGFSGQAVTSKVCVPRFNPIAGGGAWSGTVQTQGEFASFPYSVTLNASGRSMSFDAFLKVV